MDSYSIMRRPATIHVLGSAAITASFFVALAHVIECAAATGESITTAFFGDPITRQF
jgi:hypothetical protein